MTTIINTAASVCAVIACLGLWEGALKAVYDDQLSEVHQRQWEVGATIVVAAVLVAIIAGIWL